MGARRQRRQRSILYLQTMKISNKSLKIVFAAEILALALIALLWMNSGASVAYKDILPVTANMSATVTIVAQISIPTPSFVPTPVAAVNVPIQNTALPSKNVVISLTPSSVFTEEIAIGESVNKNPLTVQRFGSGQTQRLILAGIHGGYEWNTVDLANKLIEHVKENPSIIPADITLYILPVFNIDGYKKDLGPIGRANANGVDINRNFNAFWMKDWDRKGCWNQEPITAGSAPESEPETRALEAFLIEHDIDALISYHSAALGIFPGGQPPDEDAKHLAEAIHSVSAYPYPPLDYGCKYTGQLVDWAAAHDIAAIDIELSTHNELDYEINLKVLDRFLNWAR